MTELLITVAVLPWVALSIAGFYAFALPQLAWKRWTR